MKVQELVIDGFKSYATRTVISDWDDSFNCITGLNGSGKSNILDAICFVLGITTMSTVRASNQQDLIYKRGQAGVTKASVTLVFDNSDKAKSPVGFDDFEQISVTRQIVLGGTSKYLLNGHRAQQADVKKLFQSVQLNIDNPNFLIMQGQITKVLNMRPTEILALIEEAAGTRMFETRRETALKTMAKKDRDIEFNRNLLREEIEPKLDKLRSEKRDFLEYQRAQSHFERAEKLVLAHDFLELDNRLTVGTEGMEHFRTQKDDCERLITSLEGEITDKQEQLEQARQKRRERGAEQVLDTLEAKQEAASQEIARLQTSAEIKASSLDEEKQKLATTQQKYIEGEQQLAEFTGQVDGFTSEHERSQRAHEEAQTQVLAKRDLLSSLETGISGSGDRETGFGSAAKKAKDAISDAQAKIGQARQRQLYLKETASSTRLSEARAELERFADKERTLRAEIEAAKAKADGSDAHTQRIDDLRNAEQDIRRSLADVTRSVDEIRRANPNLDFRIQGFSDEQVRGLVARLFTLREEHGNKALALEISAGAKLFNVVVDTDATGSKILSSGLKRRITVLPLNKINGQVLREDRVTAAKQLGEVDLALDLVEYEEDVAGAMRFVFGDTLVCRDAKTAEKVTFNPNVRAKTITWDGDVYDPRGTLSGGSKPSAKGILLTMQRFNTMRVQQASFSRELDEIQKQLAAAETTYSGLQQAQQEIELKVHELKILQDRLASGSEATLLKEAQEATEQLERTTAEISRHEEIVAEQTALLSKIEIDAAEFTANKEAKLEQIRDELQALISQESDLAARVSQNRAQYTEIAANLAQIKGDLEIWKERVVQSTATIAELERETEEVHTMIKKLEGPLAVLDQQIVEEKRRTAAADAELAQSERVIEERKRRSVEAKLELQRLANELAEAKQAHEQAAEQHAAMLAKHAWLATDRQLLGQPNTPYDFASANLGHMRKIVRTESSRLHMMQNKVNPQVMSMIESVEQREEALRRMIRQIEQDKAHIEETVQQIDGYKSEKLEQTWRKVSDDLGRVFGLLLPTSSAKLEPDEGKTAADGLNVRVRLGNLWKEGLTELSGGQRSLVALSLILALLQFRPAPMYILDEVDAALDLQHTQNIGHLIKTQFQESQFIVVSLKDGMFTNANRLFQVKFTEGTSTVTAT